MKIRRFSSTVFPVIAYLTLTLFITRNLYGKYVLYGDNPYLFQASSGRYFHVWKEYLLGQNTEATMFGTPLIALYTALLEKVFITPQLTSYILYIMPVFLVMYLVFRYTYNISKVYVISLLLGICVIVNNYTLEQFIYWPGNYFLNMIAIINLLYILYNKEFHAPVTLRGMAIIISNSLLCIHPFFLLSYLGIIVIYTICNLHFAGKSVSARRYIVLCVGILLIHSYWLVPMLHSIRGGTKADTVYKNHQDSVHNAYAKNYSVLSLIRFFNYPGNLPDTGKNSIPYNFLYVITFLVSIILLYKSWGTRHYMQNLRIPYLLFLTVSLGPNIPVLGQFWESYIYSSSYGGYLRAFNRFFIVAYLLLIFGIASSAKTSGVLIKKVYIVAFLTLYISANTPYLTGDFNGLIGGATIPQEYNKINSLKFNGGGPFSVLVLPAMKYEAYSWTMNRNINFPQTNFFNVTYFEYPIIYNSNTANLAPDTSINALISILQKDIGCHANTAEAIAGLRNMNIAYILVRKDAIDTDTRKILSNRHIIQSLSVCKDVQLVEENFYFALYSIKHTSPRLITNTEGYNAKQLSPSRYEISFDGGKTGYELTEVTLNQNFDAGWQVFENRGALLNSLWHPVKANHLMTEQGTNKWLITGYSGTNGTPYSFVVYYKPQLYFLVGISLSATALIVTTTILVTRLNKDATRQKGQLA